MPRRFWPLKGTCRESLAKLSALVFPGAVSVFRIDKSTLKRGLLIPDPLESPNQLAEPSIESFIRVTLEGIRKPGLTDTSQHFDISIQFEHGVARLLSPIFVEAINVLYDARLTEELGRTVDQALTDAIFAWIHEKTGIDSTALFSAK